MAIPHGVLKFALAGFTPAPALAVDKQSIKFDEGANTNLHELHCYKVGLQKYMLLQTFVESLHWKLFLFSNMKSWIGWKKRPGCETPGGFTKKRRKEGPQQNLGSIQG